MERTLQQSTGLRSSLLTWVLGFLGITALIKLLPRVVRYAVRRWIFGLISEIVVVVLAGLLTEKLVDRLGGRNGVAAPPARAEAPEPSPSQPSER